MELADTSAWYWSRRVAQPGLRVLLDEALLRNRIATCDMVRLELLHSARDSTEFASVEAQLDVLPDCPIEKPEWRRALWVYGQLASQGGRHQRAVKHADLLIAAAAEAAGVPLLHYDGGFDRIASITDQPMRWMAPRGSL